MWWSAALPYQPEWAPLSHCPRKLCNAAQCDTDYVVVSLLLGSLTKLIHLFSIKNVKRKKKRKEKYDRNVRLGSSLCNCTAYCQHHPVGRLTSWLCFRSIVVGNSIWGLQSSEIDTRELSGPHAVVRTCFWNCSATGTLSSDVVRDRENDGPTHFAAQIGAFMSILRAALLRLVTCGLPRHYLTTDVTPLERRCLAILQCFMTAFNKLFCHINIKLNCNITLFIGSNCYPNNCKQHIS